MAQRPAGAPPTLRWTVAGYCVVVSHLTKAYIPLLSLLRGCHGASIITRTALTPDKIQALTIDESNAQRMRQLSTMYYITALIVENIDFDAVGRKDEQIARAVRAMTKSTRPLPEHFFDLYIDFSSKMSNQQIPILCLSAIFRSSPPLILDPKTGNWMAAMFASPSNDTKSRILELIHDFLVSESKRRLVKGEPLSIDPKAHDRPRHQGHQGSHRRQQRDSRVSRVDLAGAEDNQLCQGGGHVAHPHPASCCP